MQQFPTFKYERQIWKRGYRYIAGIDEVGKGCFAGAVVAGVVVFEKNQMLKMQMINGEGNKQKTINNKQERKRRMLKYSRVPSAVQHDVDAGKVQHIVINDSKKLSARQRGFASEWIKKNALAWGVGEASASVINRVGIVKATEIAFRKAIGEANAGLRTKNKGQIDFLLVDAFY